MSCYTGISAGYFHSLAILKDGSVTGWGSNTFGQINIPIEISNNTAQIDAGYYHSLALLKDGRVTGWGYDPNGMFNVPIEIGTNAIGISLGQVHIIALLKNGVVTGWGSNTYGQTNIPAGIGNNATGISASAGGYYSLALLKDGRVTGWGNNEFGQTNIPAGIGTNATGISAGAYHSLALLKDGRVTGWGSNAFGQINIPVGIGNNAAAIAAGGLHSLALLKDGRVTGWGDNSSQQLNIPSNMQGNVTEVNAGQFHSLALLKDGRVTGWGLNDFGQINISTCPKVNQTTTFPVIPTKTFGDPSFNPGATSSSNLAVSYTSSDTNVATVAGNTITIVGAGTSAITANQAGDSNFNAATPVSQALTVNKGNQTITFPVIPTKSFGDANFSLGVISNNNTIAITYSSSNTNVATVSSNGTVTIVGVGTSTITASQAGNSNYNAATSVLQTLTVNKSNQTIIFPSISYKEINDLPFSLIANTNSNLPIYFSSSDASILYINNNIANILNIGNVIVTAYQDGNENWNADQKSITITIKKNPNINFPNIPRKQLGDLPFNLNITTDNNEIGLTYQSSNPSIATITSNGDVNILNYGKVNITASQLETNSFYSKSLTKELTIDQSSTSSSSSSSQIDYIKPSAYINYGALKYSSIIPNEVYYSYLPKAFQPHVLLLDLNLYGFDEDKIEECDIEMNAIILKTGFFHNVVKNPSLLNLEIKDLLPSTGIISNVNDYFKEKNLIKNIKVNNIFQYNTSYISGKTIYSDKKFKLIKSYINIDKPIASYTKNIPLPFIFEYKNPVSNLSYNLGEYTLAVLNEKNEQIQSGNFITGLETGFLTFLNPGKYTLILSGDEKDFLINESDINKKNENLSAISINIKTVPEEKVTEIYKENYDEIWASYYLDYTELIPGSGFYNLNNQLPQAFNIDFQRIISGGIESPSLFYKEYTGYFENNCSSSQIVREVDPICTKSLMLICAIAASYEASGKKDMDVPRKNLPRSKYSAITSAVNLGSSSFTISKLTSEEATLERPWITYLEDPSDINYHTIAIDDNLKETCCYCKSEQAECPECITDPFLDVQNQIYSGIQFSESGDAIYNSVYFLDEISPKGLQLIYNNSIYSGQIIYKGFEEGDKLIFNQYQYDFNNVFKKIYDLDYIPVDKEPVKKEFIFSKVLIGANYFSGKNDLINKINQELANKNYYTWIPFKYNPNIEFSYGPLLSGKNGGVNLEGEEIIDLIALNSGKLGAYNLKLQLKERNKIYNYMVPKVIKLQISEDGENWIDVISSETLQPINTYLKSPNDIVSNIKYENIPNTTVTIEKTITVSSETSSQNKGSSVENLAELATGLWNASPLNTGNKNNSSSSSSNSVICIPSITGSGKYCGSGYVDFVVGNVSNSPSKGFKCSIKEEKEDCGVWKPSGNHLVSKCNVDIIDHPKYQGYSGDCCTGKYDPINKPFGWCCSGVYIEGVNEIGCKPCEDKEQKNPIEGETKSEETIKVKETINTFRIGFYDYKS